MYTIYVYYLMHHKVQSDAGDTFWHEKETSFTTCKMNCETTTLVQSRERGDRFLAIQILNEHHNMYKTCQI